MPPTKSKARRTWKTLCRGEIKKSGMADYIWREMGNHMPLWNDVKIIEQEEDWRMRRFKEAVHMLGYGKLFSRPSIKMNAILEPIMKMSRLKKIYNNELK